MRSRIALTIHSHAAALAIPQQRANAHGLRKLVEQQAMMFGLAPRQNGGLNGWL